MTTRLASALGALLLLAGTAPAMATPLATDGTWTELRVDGNLPPYTVNWIDDNYADQQYTFTILTIAAGFEARLTVVDAGFSGDRFTVLDNGVVLGVTGPAVDGDVNGNPVFDYDAALADASFSRGQWILNAGSHSITGYLSTSLADANGPLFATIGGLNVTISPIPEPSTFGLMAVGAVLLSLARRRSGAR